LTDLFEWGQRSVPLTLAAEIQHRLLPSAYTCEAGQFSLAGWLEPAGNIAGDTFDFSLDRDTLHLSMTDAMGHSVQAAMLASVLVGALRNGRRARVDLAEQARLASASLAEHFHRSEYVTGQLVRIDLQSETGQIIQAGHPPPLRLRDGHVTSVELMVDLPFGWGEHEYRMQPLPLAPGDRAGVSHRRSAGAKRLQPRHRGADHSRGGHAPTRGGTASRQSGPQTRRRPTQKTTRR
jgi:serine phosphatase RsbU (regulator of sigma subunit)